MFLLIWVMSCPCKVQVLAAGLWLSPVICSFARVENVEDPFDISQMRPLIDSYDPRGIPLKPNLVSFYNLNPYPINRCHEGKILVQYTSVLSEFSAGCAGKERYLLWYADSSWCPCCCQGSTANKGFSVVTSPISASINVQGTPCMKSSRIFCGAIPNSRTAVLEPS